MRERWLSRRAVFLHIACLLFVPFCIAATWWQITRAEDGNGLSYLYTFEWPVFAIVGIYFWWQFLHTDYDTVGLKGMRNQEAEATADAKAEASTPDVDTDAAEHLEPATALAMATHTRSDHHSPTTTIAPAAAATATTATATAAAPGPPPAMHTSTPAPTDTSSAAEDENPELAAYNARLAALSASGPKTWRKPETPIARRPQ